MGTIKTGLTDLMRESRKAKIRREEKEDKRSDIKNMLGIAICFGLGIGFWLSKSYQYGWRIKQYVPMLPPHAVEIGMVAILALLAFLAVYTLMQYRQHRILKRRKRYKTLAEKIDEKFQ